MALDARVHFKTFVRVNLKPNVSNVSAFGTDLTI